MTIGMYVFERFDLAAGDCGGCPDDRVGQAFPKE